MFPRILNPLSHLRPHPIPRGCPRAPALGALPHASNLPWSSILHMVIYMFQCYSLILSQPRLHFFFFFPDLSYALKDLNTRYVFKRIR